MRQLSIRRAPPNSGDCGRTLHRSSRQHDSALSSEGKRLGCLALLRQRYNRYLAPQQQGKAWWWFAPQQGAYDGLASSVISARTIRTMQHHAGSGVNMGSINTVQSLGSWSVTPEVGLL